MISSMGSRSDICQRWRGGRKSTNNQAYSAGCRETRPRPVWTRQQVPYGGIRVIMRNLSMWRRLVRVRTLAVIISRNSLKSMVPEPSVSMSAIIFLISSFLGSKPRARMATLSSLASIEPEPSVSKRSKASRISCFCSSVRANL